MRPISSCACGSEASTRAPRIACRECSTWTTRGPGACSVFRLIITTRRTSWTPPWERWPSLRARERRATGQDHRDRAELPGSRRRARKYGTRQTAAVLQAAHGRDRRRRRGRAAARIATGGLRGRDRRRHRTSAAARHRKRGARGHRRDHVRQRRHRAGHAAGRGAVDPGEGVRHVLPHRAPHHARGPGPIRRARGVLPGERQTAPARPRARHGVFHSGACFLRLAGHDARAGRPDRHGNARRRGAARARRPRRSGDSRGRCAAESCGRGETMKLSVLLLAPVVLQPQAPKSQHATVTQTLGTTQVTIVYNRPSARGRTLFGRGGVVPWGKVWCPGADTATTIALSRDMVVGGQPLAAGKYSIWAIPGPDEWTLIFNRAADVFHIPYPGAAGRVAAHGEAASRTVHGIAGVLLPGRRSGSGAPEPALGRDDRAGLARGEVAAFSPRPARAGPANS